MTNIFTPSILDEFKTRVPELSKIIDSVELKLEPTSLSPFEMLIRSIVYQQLSGKAAKTIHDRMVKLVRRLTPNSVLKTSQEELRSIGLSRQKASYIHNVAEAFGKGGFLWKYRKVESLAHLSSEEITDLFVQIKGVGEWTVQMYLIFSLGRLDVLSESDLGVRKGIMVLYRLKEIPTPKEVKEIAKKWHPLETVGTFLAWRALEEDFVFP
jgi:DNA-3-methyladenine glycosylase II